jgi:hypothetical protein
MEPRAGLDDVENRKFLTLPWLELRPLGRSARSQSLYRLRYPGSLTDRRNTRKRVSRRSVAVGATGWLHTDEGLVALPSNSHRYAPVLNTRSNQVVRPRVAFR